MRIDSVRKRGRTITLRGSFQPEDLRRVLDMANAGTLTRTTSGLTSVPADRLPLAATDGMESSPAAAEHSR